MSRRTSQTKTSAGAQCIGVALRPRLLPLKAASQFLGVSPWCLRELAWKGKVPVVQFGGRKWFFRVSDLDRLVEEHVKLIQ